MATHERLLRCGILAALMVIASTLFHVVTFAFKPASAVRAGDACIDRYEA